MNLDAYIRSVHLDEHKRIVITVQENFQSYLKMEKIKNLLMKEIANRLAPDFEKMEVGQKGVRITVKAGTEEKNMEVVKKELKSALKLAIKYLFFK